MLSDRGSQNPQIIPRKSSSSTQAQHGSSGGRASVSPASRPATREGHEQLHENDRLGMFMEDTRDHRSLTVKEFDNHQDEAKKRHKEELDKIVAKQY